MNCQRCASVLERGDLRCPVCSLEAEVPAAANEVKTQVLRCRDCHAALEYSAKLEKAVCGFCAATLDLEYSTDPVEHAEGAVPFVLDETAAKNVLSSWLGKRGFFAPSDLATQSRIDSLRKVGWSAWVVTGQALATYGADVWGLGSKASYGPIVGQLARTLQLLVPATKGLSAGEVTQLGAYDVGDVQVHAAADVICEDFGVTRSSARARILQDVKADAVAELGRQHRGRNLKHAKVDVMLTGLTTKRVLLPAWIMAYQHNGKRFRVVIHGQNGTVVGTSPISVWKVLATIGVAFGIIAVLIALLAIAEHLK